MKDNKLEVGDVLYRDSRWHGIQRYIIERLTPKTAISGYMKFKIDVEDRGGVLSVPIIGEYGSVDLETQKLKDEYRLLIKRRKLSGILRSTSTNNMDERMIDEILFALSNQLNKENP